MKINFFEEFPTKENLQKASLIKFPCIIFIASKSWSEFQKYKEEVEKINPLIESAYWPIFKDSYWISPFSPPNELKRIDEEISDIKTKEIKILLDLELPFKHPSSFLKHALLFRKNKKTIKSILEKAKLLGINIYTSEYPISIKLLSFLGISYSTKTYGHKIIPMYYSSITNYNILRKYLAKRFSKQGIEENHIALGTIAKGILGTEPILPAINLKSDIEYFKNKVETITIFRLGGINQEYLDVINQFK